LWIDPAQEELHLPLVAPAKASFIAEELPLPFFESSRTRRDFVLNSAAFSLASVFSRRLLAQQDSSYFHPADDIQGTVIPRDTRLKFNPDGSRRVFAGNTVICHLPQQSQIHGAVTALGEGLRSSSFARKLAILPSESYHVTILGGLNDADRNQAEWPNDIPITAPSAECNRIVEQRFAQYKTDEKLPIRFRLDKERTRAPQLASGLQLLPADATERMKLSRLRDRLADEVFRYRAKNHETFRFHISLAYQMSGFTPKEAGEYQAILDHHIPIIINSAPVIELGLPEFCTFKDMDRFDVRILLRT
jgi:hypothetical protein